MTSARIESAAVFATAMGAFPSLRNLTFDGIIKDLAHDSTVVPPVFRQPCDLAVNTEQPRTWLAIRQWALLDLPRIGKISLRDSDSIATLRDYIPSWPELASRIQEVAVYYIFNRKAEWPRLDEDLSQFQQLRALRVHTLRKNASPTDRDLDGQDVGLVDKLVGVTKRQMQISPSLREVFLEIPTELFMAPSAREAVARLDAELSRLNSLSRIHIHMSYHRYPGVRWNDEILKESYGQKLPLLTQTGRLVITIAAPIRLLYHRH
ncbi:hypothetical protein AURDEDRAFT_179904 [Auricularia subglabra TFB-10046 SS5]|nr:hypothetical protein AURDEDRAFT_179904 [Auricularia subglabra TFB-10046 SS5]